MDSNKKPADNEKVTCQACKKSMAADDAITPEASDYYLHFCGLDCYAQWKRTVGGKQNHDDKLSR